MMIGNWEIRNLKSFSLVKWEVESKCLIPRFSVLIVKSEISLKCAKWEQEWEVRRLTSHFSFQIFHLWEKWLIIFHFLFLTCYFSLLTLHFFLAHFSLRMSSFSLWEVKSESFQVRNEIHTSHSTFISFHREKWAFRNEELSFLTYHFLIVINQFTLFPFTTVRLTTFSNKWLV